MDERTLEKIKKYLQDSEAQERIQQSTQRGRLEATVTIGRVAQLFDVKESKIRDWESRGLLTPLRSKEKTGQRQYSPSELDKLAIIKELVDEGGFGPADIPDNIENIWKSISDSNGQQGQTLKLSEKQREQSRAVDLMPIDMRIHHAYHDESFWRYYASRALWLSLMLICEDIPNTIAGILLPLQTRYVPVSLRNPENVHKIGDTLVGWLGQSRSFYTLISSAPSFEHPSDFRILPLQAIEQNMPKDGVLEDPTLLVIQRKTILNLSQPVVDVVRRLLEPLYKEVPNWHLYLGQGMRDIVDPLIDFNSGPILSDILLTGFAERVVEIGGQNDERQPRWRFCCILVPNNSQLPLQQRSLVVRAKSKNAPSEYKVGTTIVSPDMPILSLSLRAFQSGYIIYRHIVTAEDTSVVHREIEEPIGSAIAVPVGGEGGVPVAVIYIVSAESDAFSGSDQRLLRMIGRIVEELLITYHARLKATEKFTNLIKRPDMVDSLFEVFASENAFISDLENLLSDIERDLKKERNQFHEEVISFIAIDIDNQSNIAIKYGDQIMRNLNKAVGLRIQELLPAILTNYGDCELYRIYADRYYLLLKNISLEKAREKAEQFRQNLKGPISIEQPPFRDSMLVLPDITVHLGVTSYTNTKLADYLQRPQYPSVADISAMMAHTLDLSLKMGVDEGGNVVISWDKGIRGFVRWSPPRK